MKPKTKHAEQPSIFKASAVAELIKTTEAELATLQERKKLVALDSITGSNIGTALADVNSSIAATLAKLEDLRPAYVAAMERDQKEEARQLAAQARSQLAAIKKFLDRQHEAGQALSKAIGAAGIAYRTLLENGEKAMSVALLPGMAWPAGMDCRRGTLDRLIAAEIYRLTAKATLSGNDVFPTPRCEARYVMQPERIPCLIDELKSLREHILSTLTGGEVA